MTTPGTRWLSEAELHAWKALVTTTITLLGILDRELQREHGLSLGEYEVLALLSDMPERSMRMVDLAGMLHLTPSGITRRIDGLVRAGFVERCQCASDRRGSNAVLTAEGLRRLEEAAPTHVRGVRAHFVDRLSAGELANLDGALDSVALGLDRERAAGACDDAG